jgi:Ca2+-binding RTX toxin-like protein
VTSFVRRLGGEATAHAITTGNQLSPAVAALIPGGYVVVWSDQNGDGSGLSIHAQRFDSSGAKVGAELLVNSTAFESQNNPVVVGLSSGGFAVAWIHQDPQGGDGIGMSIRARAFNADGVPLAADFLVNTTVDGQQNAPALVALADGGFVAIWHGPLAGGEAFEIVAQRFSAAGAKVGMEFRANAAVAGGQDYPSGAALEGGGYVLVWNHAAGGVGDGDDVRGQRFDSESNPVGAEFVLSTPNGSGITPGRQYQPDVAGLPGGGFVAVWQSFNSALGRWEARGQIFGADGATVGSEFIASNAADDPSGVTVASFGWGGFVVGWDNAAMGGSASERAQLFDALGGRLGDQAQLNLVFPGLVPGLDMAGTAGGRFVATWRDNANDVKVQLFTAGIHGTVSADNLGGTGMDDDVYGHAGDDQLDGGAGADSLTGGGGDDVYFVDNAGDVVSELPGEGTDEVRTGLTTYVLPANVEKLTGASDVAHDFRGNGSDNVLTGGAGGDIFRLQDGGEDTALGGAGNDGFLFGAALSAGDVVDGGAGSGDQLGLQGNYGSFGVGAAAFAFGAGHLAGIEVLILLSGSDARFGDTAGNSYSYNLATLDVNVAAGQQLVVSFNTLRAGENVTFDGSAETDGSFMTYGGLGLDTLTGGQQSDGFYFGADGRFASGDRVDGRGGSLDQLGLQGDYSGAGAISFGANSMANIEMLVLLGAGDNRFGGGSGDGFSYDIIMHDSNVAAGARMYISANTLRTDGALTETLDFDGSAEKDGFFIVYAGTGADTIVGGQGADEIWGRGGSDVIKGGLGADILRGGEGDDVFVYNAVAESGAGSRDTILDFTSGSDRIDLSGIDADSLQAGDQAFTWIGSNAFSGAAGELRAYQDSASGTWIVQGDVNGDGTADFQIGIVLAPPDSLVGSDFIV